jgi:hypothetical protein
MMQLRVIVHPVRDAGMVWWQGVAMAGGAPGAVAGEAVARGWEQFQTVGGDSLAAVVASAVAAAIAAFGREGEVVELPAKHHGKGVLFVELCGDVRPVRVVARAGINAATHGAYDGVLPGPYPRTLVITLPQKDHDIPDRGRVIEDASHLCSETRLPRRRVAAGRTDALLPRTHRAKRGTLLPDRKPAAGRLVL